MTHLVFWLLIATVAIAPLPLASNRPLPWSVLSALVAVMLLLWGIDRVRAVLRRGTTFTMAATASTGSPAPPTPAPVIIDRLAFAFALVFGALIAWYWFQLTPASEGLANPAWAEAARALGETLPGAIALDPGVGEQQAMKLLAYGGVFFLAFVLCRDRQRARWAFIALAAVGLAYAAYGLYALFAGYKTIIGLVPSSYTRAVTSTFVNRNSYATYAGLGVIIAMGPLLSELRHVLRSGTSTISTLRTVSEEATPVLYLSALAIAAGVMAVILTGSRAGVASLLLGLAVFALGMLVVRDLSLRAFLVLIGVGALGVGAVMMLSGGFLVERVSDGMERDARWVLFEIGRQVAGERPVTGHGLGGFAAAFNGGLRAPPGFEAYVDFAHNTYLELAVEGGIPALLISLALAGMAVGICIAALFTRSRGTSFAIAAIAGTALIAGHSMADFSLQMPAVAVTFMLMLGVASAQSLASQRIRREVPAAGDAASADTPQRKRRRRRRSSDRPSSADDSVTPPPELAMPWQQPGAAGRGSHDFAKPAPQVPLAHDRGDAPEGVGLQREFAATRGDTLVAEDSGESYRAALARWQSLRQATAARPTAPQSPQDQPQSGDIRGPVQTAASPGAAAPSGTEDKRHPVDAAAPQPPMPPVWPGEARRPGVEPTPAEHGPDKPAGSDDAPGNVVHLPRSRRP